MFSKPRKIECRQNTVPAFTDSVLAGIGGLLVVDHARMVLSQKTVDVGRLGVRHTKMRDRMGSTSRT